MIPHSSDNAFRAMHTFKGNSGLFNFGELERLGHDFETILEEYKAGIKPVEQKGNHPDASGPGRALRDRQGFTGQ